MKITVAEVRKTVVAVLGVAAEAVALGVLTGSAAHWVGVVISALTAVGIYAVPNANTAGVLREAARINNRLPAQYRVPDVATATPIVPPTPEVKS